MKKLFVSILALAAFTACQSNFEDVTTNTPGLGDQTLPEGLVRIYAEVGIGDAETKATYGSDLSAMWEENDQIALLQESANYNSLFSTVNKLNIKSGAGTNCAMFNGDITVPTESPRVYHIAYPADAVSIASDLNLSYTNLNADQWDDANSSATGYFYATADFTYTYTSSLNITVPESQNGKWVPYMHISTDGAVSSNGIGAKTLNTLTGAIAVRAYASDGKTPIQLRSIAVTSTAPIAGAFTGISVSKSNVTLTGDRTSDYYSTVSEDDIFGWKGKKYGREAATNLLMAKAQAYQPTTIDVTQAMSLSFAGDKYTVGAENMGDIVADADGFYTYCLNVAPFKDATLTIMATAMDGSTLIRTINETQSLEAGHRKGFIFTWEDMGLSSGTVETWYDSYANDHNCTLAKNAIYVNDIAVKGVSADQVTAVGVRVYDATGNLYEDTAEAGTLSLSQVVVSGLPSGVYTVCAYAKVLVDGVEKELLGSVVARNVTSEPADASVIQSSYSKNGGTSLNNSIGGRELQITPKFSDENIPASLVKNCTIVYGGTTVSGALNSTMKKTDMTLGQYNCYVKFELTNGYTCQSDTYTAYITGIPYTMDVSANDGTWTEESGEVNWNTNGGLRLGYNWNNWFAKETASVKRSFAIPENTSISITANGSIQGSSNATTATFNINVSGSSIYSTSNKSSTAQNWSTTSTGTLTSSTPTIQLHSYKSTNTCNTTIKALQVNYNY